MGQAGQRELGGGDASRQLVGWAGARRWRCGEHQALGRRSGANICPTCLSATTPNSTVSGRGGRVKQAGQRLGATGCIADVTDLVETACGADSGGPPHRNIGSGSGHNRSNRPSQRVPAMPRACTAGTVTAPRTEDYGRQRAPLRHCVLMRPGGGKRAASDGAAAGSAQRRRWRELGGRDDKDAPVLRPAWPRQAVEDRRGRFSLVLGQRSAARSPRREAYRPFRYGDGGQR